MAFRKQRVPDLLSNLPNGDSSAQSKSQVRGVSSPKTKSPLASAGQTPAQSTRSGSGRVLSTGGGQLLAQKTRKPIPTADCEAANAGKEAQDADVKPDAELTFKELLELSMEENAQKVFDLDLRQKQIKSIPFAIKEFKRLKILDLSSNAILEICNLMENKELRELKLYDNRITSICLLDSLKELSSLQMQYNKIAKIGSGLSPLKKLNSLKMNNNEIMSIEIKELAPLSQLVYLDVSFNHLQDISAIVCLPNLEELWADNNQLGSLPDFSRCRKLRDLHVSHNQLTSLATLRSAPLLEELDASQNRIGEFPAAVGPLQRLTCLNLGDNHLLDFDWLPTACPGVYTLDVSNNGPSELDEELATVLRRLENLFELSFVNCETPVAAVQRLLPGLDFFNGFSLNRPSTGGQSRAGGPPPPMRPMSAASAVSARQVENQMRGMESRLESLEEQTEQAFLHMRSRIGQQLAPAPEPISTSGDASASDEPPMTGRTSRHNRLRDALQFGRQSVAM